MQCLLRFVVGARGDIMLAMCGRYVSPDEASIEREFSLVHHEWQFPISYNGAPTQSVPVVRIAADGGRTGVLMHWGLIPYWAKGIRPKYSTINATVEKLTEAATWCGPWSRGQRCILPATCFFRDTQCPTTARTECRPDAVGTGGLRSRGALPIRCSGLIPRAISGGRVLFVLKLAVSLRRCTFHRLSR